MQQQLRFDCWTRLYKLDMFVQRDERVGSFLAGIEIEMNFEIFWKTGFGLTLQISVLLVIQVSFFTKS